MQEQEAQLQAQAAWEEMATESLLREGALHVEVATLRLQLADQQLQQQGLGQPAWQGMLPTLTHLPDPVQLAAMPALRLQLVAPEVAGPVEEPSAPVEEPSAPVEEPTAHEEEEPVDLRWCPFSSPIPSSQPEEGYGEEVWPAWPGR